MFSIVLALLIAAAIVVFLPETKLLSFRDRIRSMFNLD